MNDNLSNQIQAPVYSADVFDKALQPGNPPRPQRTGRTHETGRRAHAADHSGTRKDPSDTALDQRAARSVDVSASPKSIDAEETRFPGNDFWLSTEEVSRRLKIPAKTLNNWASLGKGPRFARMGRFRRYRLSDLVAWEEVQLEKGGGSRPAPNHLKAA